MRHQDCLLLPGCHITANTVTPNETQLQAPHEAQLCTVIKQHTKVGRKALSLSARNHPSKPDWEGSPQMLPGLGVKAVEAATSAIRYVRAQCHGNNFLLPGNLIIAILRTKTTTFKISTDRSPRHRFRIATRSPLARNRSTGVNLSESLDGSPTAILAREPQATLLQRQIITGNSVSQAPGGGRDRLSHVSPTYQPSLLEVPRGSEAETLNPVSPRTRCSSTGPSSLHKRKSERGSDGRWSTISRRRALESSRVSPMLSPRPSRNWLFPIVTTRSVVQRGAQLQLVLVPLDGGLTPTCTTQVRDQARMVVRRPMLMPSAVRILM